MPDRPRILVFDVNETLSDMAPMSDRFEEVGAAAFALTAADGWASFAEVGRAALRPVLEGRTLNRSTQARSTTSSPAWPSCRFTPMWCRGCAGCTPVAMHWSP